jgi:FMN phosphatase YigB (HAD superfamily)
MKTPVLLDCGDTLANEITEVKNERGETLHADLIPGADTLVRELSQRGHPLALCADGPVATFENILNQHKIYDCFDTFAISGAVGVQKPDERMFRTALEGLDVHPKDYGSAIMVGNNLERDIAGANALGLTTVFLAWSSKRRKTPETRLETPDHTIQNPLDLLELLVDQD